MIPMSKVTVELCTPTTYMILLWYGGFLTNKPVVHLLLFMTMLTQQM